jgi:hypothetical protein
MKPACHICHHRWCGSCLQKTWKSFVPAAGINVICCRCESVQLERVRGNGNGNGRGRGKGNLFIVQRRDQKLFRYPPEVEDGELLLFSKDQETAMTKIVKAIKLEGGDDDGE